MNLSNYQSQGLETGVWLEFDGAQFLVASIKGTAFSTAVARRSRKLNPAEMKKKPELFLQLQTEVIADKILLDWKGVEDNGEPVPCTRENKLRVLALPEFREWLETASSDMENFRQEATAEDAEALKSGA